MVMVAVVVIAVVMVVVIRLGSGVRVAVISAGQLFPPTNLITSSQAN